MNPRLPWNQFTNVLWPANQRIGNFLSQACTTQQTYQQVRPQLSTPPRSALSPLQQTEHQHSPVSGHNDFMFANQIPTPVVQTGNYNLMLASQIPQPSPVLVNNVLMFANQVPFPVVQNENHNLMLQNQILLPVVQNGLQPSPVFGNYEQILANQILSQQQPPPPDGMLLAAGNHPSQFYSFTNIHQDENDQEYDSDEERLERCLARSSDTPSTEWTNSPRYWKFFNKKGAKPHGRMKISVMSYNLLSQMLLEEHSYLYKDCYEEDLEWSYRSQALMKQFEHHMSDILCLQEVQEDHWQDFYLPELKSLGYEGHFIKRTGLKPDGCAILFRQRKFKLIRFIPVNFQRGGLLDRDNVGIILLLKPRRKYYGGKVRQICVATTHLLFNPRRGDVKLAQLMLFLAEIEKCSHFKNFDQSNSSSNSSEAKSESETVYTNEHPYCPIILCGDMNLEPYSHLYNFLIKGCLNYDACISQELSGQSEGMGRSCFYVQTELLPENLGINDHCQFIEDVISRQASSRVTSAQNLSISKTNGEKSTQKEKAGEAASTNSDKKTSPIVDNNDNIKQIALSHTTAERDTAGLHKRPSTLVNTGRAFHNFRFQSVYPHQARHKLVTTHHGKASCMVDYIFYASGETIPGITYHRSGAESDKDVNKSSKSKKKDINKSSNSKSAKKKRELSESYNSEQKSSSYQSPFKTLRTGDQCEPVVSLVENGGVENERVGAINNKNRNVVVHKDHLSQESSQNLQSGLGTGKVLVVNLEPGEVVSSIDLCNSSQDENTNSVPDSDIDNDNPKKETAVQSGVDDKPVKALELLGYWSLLSVREFDRIGSLPNDIFPSDHVCLIAKFLLH